MDMLKVCLIQSSQLDRDFHFKLILGRPDNGISQDAIERIIKKEQLTKEQNET